MSDTTGPSFRDFASQLFGGDLDGAARTLETLLAISPEVARSAAENFRSKMTDPSFMPKAMSLRTAVAGSDDAAISSLLGECFGLDEATVKSATAALRARYALSRSAVPPSSTAPREAEHPPGRERAALEKDSQQTASALRGPGRLMTAA